MRHISKREQKRRLRKLYKETKNNCLSGVYFDSTLGRLVRYYRIHAVKGLRHLYNKRVRRFTGEIKNGKHFLRISGSAKYDAL